MGQIVFNGQKPKYCNLTAITTGSKKDYVIPAGEVWLIDSTNTSKTDGTGKYDKYIIGDSSHTASYLATNALMNIDNALQIEIDSAPTSGSNNAVSSGGVYQALLDIDVTSQISGKANKSEMSVVAGTGANADKTTITLKSGTSAAVLTQHQDVSEFLKEGEVFGTGDDSTASFNSYSDTVWNKQQTLSESQKQQIRDNIGVSVADNEDIQNISGKLKFADKAYNTSAHSGLGRKYLRKNIIDGKNVLTQAMVNTANTIYHIQYDYDLNGQTITVPEGCVLEFEGGSLRNGTIVGQDTAIKASIVSIFNDIVLSGAWNIVNILPEWFGAGGNDDSDAIEMALQCCYVLRKPLFLNADYKVFGNTSYGLNAPNLTRLRIYGNGRIFWTPSEKEDSLFYLGNNIENLSISDITILVNSQGNGIVFHLTSTLAANRGNRYINMSVFGNTSTDIVDYIFMVDGTTHCDIAKVDRCVFSRFNNLFYSDNSEAVAWTFSECSIGSSTFGSTLFEFNKLNAGFNVLNSSFSVWSGCNIVKTNPLLTGATNGDIVFKNDRFEFYNTINGESNTEPCSCSLYFGKLIFDSCNLALATNPTINLFAYAVGSIILRNCALPHIVCGAGMLVGGETITRGAWIPRSILLEDSSFLSIAHKLLSDDGTVSDISSSNATNNFGATLVKDCYNLTTRERLNYEIVSTNTASKDYRREFVLSYNKAFVAAAYNITIPPFQEVTKIEVSTPSSTAIDSVSIDFGGVTTINKNVKASAATGRAVVFDGTFYSSNVGKRYVKVTPTLVGGTETSRNVEITIHYRCVFMELIRSMPTNEVIVKDTSHYANAANIGDSANRPSNVQYGFMYLDTTLGKPIWSTASGWVDATGMTVQ